MALGGCRGTELAYGATRFAVVAAMVIVVLFVRVAAPILLRACVCAMCGTDMQRMSQVYVTCQCHDVDVSHPDDPEPEEVGSYALATPCPGLTQRIMLPGRRCAADRGAGGGG
eukprot:2190718-Rhodomonas_salina.1